MKKFEYIAIFLIIILAVSSTFIIVKYINTNKFFSDNTGLYFFSAILQANAAILSIVGVFIIFRIQSYQSPIDIIRNSFLIEFKKWTNPDWILDFDNSSLEGKKEKFKNAKYDKDTMPRLSEWIKNEEKILKTKSSIILPSLLLSSGAILSIIGLLLINHLHCSFENYEFHILYLFSIFEITTIVSVVKTILNSFG